MAKSSEVKPDEVAEEAESEAAQVEESSKPKEKSPLEEAADGGAFDMVEVVRELARQSLLANLGPASANADASRRGK